MAWKHPRTAELYRTRGDSLAALDTTRANFRAGAAPTSQTRVQRPYEWSREGRAGSYPSCAGSERLGDRRTEWRSRALGDEANVVGLQDEEASYSPAFRSPAETQRSRCGWRRLSL